MRVIGGRSRGRRLAAKLPTTVRPTSDRVREAIFDILGSLGGVEELHVVDLFCGSGALGVEALSRGAASATFVDLSADALAAVRTNLRAVGLGDESVTLVRASLPGWLQAGAGEGAGEGTGDGARAGSGRNFDLALCDPPYDFDEWPALLEALRAEVVVMESAAPIPLPEESWMSTRERRYGGTLVTVAQRSGSAS